MGFGDFQMEFGLIFANSVKERKRDNIYIYICILENKYVSTGIVY